MKKIYSLLIALLALVGVAQAQTVTFDATKDVYGTDTGKTGAMSITKDGVTIAITGGTLANGTDYRFYKNQTLTVSCESEIAEIVLTCTANGTSKYGPGCFEAQEGYSYEGKVGTWTGSSTSVSFKAATDQVRATQIEVTIKNTDPNYVAPPKITPETGTYYEAQTVTITCITEGATIYYTTDDSSPVAEKGGPSETAIQYSEPFVVEKTTTIKAVAIKDGPSSEMTESEITIEQAASKTIAEILAAGPANGVQASATVVAVSSVGVLLQDATGYIFKYTGEEPGVAVGDVVTVIGETKEYGGRLQFTENGSMDKTGTATVSYPTAVVLDGAAFDALVADIQVQYIEVAATVTSVGNYYNLSISGATNTGSLIAASDVLSQLKVNDVVKITGFFVYVTGTSKKYGYIIATKVDLPEVEYTEFNTFAAAKAAAPAAEADAVNAQLNLNEAIVVFVSGQSVYLNDKEHGMLVYGTNSKNLKTGDIISGTIKGKLYKRNGNTQVANPIYDVNVVESGFGILPRKVAATDLLANGANYENELVLIEYLVPQATALESRNINFDAYADDSFEQSVGVVAVRDNWNIATDFVFNEETPYTVTGFVTLYTKNEDTTIQLYPRTAADLDNGEVPSPYDFVGDGSFENPYTVADIQHKDATDTKTAFEEDVWVKAFIVGYIQGSSLSASTAVFSASAPEGKTVLASNVLVADVASANTIAQIIPVALPNGGARADLNLLDNPGKLGAQVWLKGDIYKYMGVPGLKEVKVYSLDGQTIIDAINDITIENAVANKTIYTIAGQRVQNLNKRGLYIVNGKKVVVK